MESLQECIKQAQENHVELVKEFVELEQNTIKIEVAMNRLNEKHKDLQQNYDKLLLNHQLLVEEYEKQKKLVDKLIQDFHKK